MSLLYEIRIFSMRSKLHSRKIFTVKHNNVETSFNTLGGSVKKSKLKNSLGTWKELLSYSYGLHVMSRGLFQSEESWKYNPIWQKPLSFLHIPTSYVVSKKNSSELNILSNSVMLIFYYFNLRMVKMAHH